MVVAAAEVVAVDYWEEGTSLPLVPVMDWEGVVSQEVSACFVQ